MQSTATIRPGDGAAVSAPRTAIAAEANGALAEAMSTALLVADDAQVARLRGDPPAQRMRFDFTRAAADRAPVEAA